MATPDYRTYLATSVLTEDKIVTYRLLSRALKVHVNKAKQMLFDFHRLQNAKKPGSIHATYIVYGIRHKIQLPATTEDEDTIMASSPPFPSSSAPPTNEAFLEDIPVSTMTLVREEHLDTLRNEFESITSVHLYSVGPWQLKDLQMLSDATREIRLIDADRDLIEYGKIYGSATNPNVKRRSGRRPPPITVPEEVERASVAPPKSKAIETTKQSSDDKTPSSSKPESKPSQSQASKDFFAKDPKSSSAQATTTKKAEAKPPTLKRDSSSIFKAFAKTKPPKLKNEDSDSVTGASGMDSANATDAEDQPMKDVDDDDEEDDYVVPTSKSDRNTRKEREAALKAMMDDDDEGEEEKVSGDSQNDTNAESESQEAPAPPQEKETVTVEGGRRRGRRRVMKKRTMKDEEGYLVTKEEAAWESFSEDEPVAPKPKPAVIVAPVKKGKGEAAKKGQGSIMSFFGKPKK